MNAQQAKQIPISEFLKTQGCLPVKENATEAWYCSPFRAEAEASFKIHKPKNIYYDHGEGAGGNLLDLAMRMFSTDLPGALRKLSELNLGPTAGLFSFHQQADFFDPTPALPGGQGSAPALKEQSGEERDGSIRIKRLEPLQNKALTKYLASERGINLNYAKMYLRQAYFDHKGREFFALAFPNDKGGFELRNPYFQGGTHPKHWTTLLGRERDKGKCWNTLNVFEGFMDFLSALTHWKSSRMEGDVVVLNSLSFARPVSEVAKEYRQVNLFLDNDPAGRSAAATWFPEAANRAAEVYPNSKDFNDFIRGRAF